VKWKVEYFYRVEVSNTITSDTINGPMIANVYTKKEVYEFKGRQFQTAEELVNVIRKDLK
jgi:hypothetical protein